MKNGAVTQLPTVLHYTDVNKFDFKEAYPKTF